MSKRKRYIIDKKFQIQTTFSIIGLVSILSAIIIAVIAVNIVYNNTKIQEINTKIENIHEIQNHIVEFLTTRQATREDTLLAKAMSDIAQKHSKNMETLRNNMVTLNSIIEYNKLLMMILILLILLQGAVLYILMIKRTHRISGPIYVMSNYIKEILEDKMPEPRKLREKDDLKEFYELFIKLVEKIRNDKKQQ